MEMRQLETAERLQRCLALFSVIAWRIVFTTMLAHAIPAEACTAVLDTDEWQALYCHIHHTTTLPPTPPSLRGCRALDCAIGRLPRPQPRWRTRCQSDVEGLSASGWIDLHVSIIATVDHSKKCG